MPLPIKAKQLLCLYPLRLSLRHENNNVMKVKIPKKNFFFFCFKIILKPFFHHFEGQKKNSIFSHEFYMGMQFQLSCVFSCFLAIFTYITKDDQKLLSLKAKLRHDFNNAKKIKNPKTFFFFFLI